MNRVLKVIYHYHSGFSVQVGGSLLIFDYWEGEHGELEKGARITTEYLRAFEQVYVFISHSHPDHFDRVVYSWETAVPNITYIVAGDMPIGTRGRRISPLQEKELSPSITVKAFPSTDLGVSFLVSAYGMNIFHAGDLNLWHWRNESSLQEIQRAENDFYNALEPIKGENIDIAMFPVDPRQGLMYDAGANHFILTLKPRVFIPMHWWEREEVARDFARRARNPQTEVLALNRPGMTANFSFEDDGVLNIRVIEPPRDYASVPIAHARRPGDPPDENDPFADSDLPVDI